MAEVIPHRRGTCTFLCKSHDRGDHFPQREDIDDIAYAQQSDTGAAFVSKYTCSFMSTLHVVQSAQQASGQQRVSIMLYGHLP